MLPVLMYIRGVPIHSYLVMLYLALLSSTMVGSYAAHAAGLDSARAVIAMVLLTLPGLLGARAWHVVLHRRIYVHDWARVWRFSEGGAAFYGAVPAVLLCSVPVLALLGLPFGAFWDAAAYGALIGLIPGRVGCLLHGCCAGRPSESMWALPLTDAWGVRQRRLPTPLLEAAWAAALLLAAIPLHNKLPVPGALFLLVLCGYAVGRLLLEPTRARPSRWRAVLPNQAASLVVMIAALAVLLYRWPG